MEEQVVVLVAIQKNGSKDVANKEKKKKMFVNRSERKKKECNYAH